MKSFFNHWRLSISPDSVGKINSHQQPFESRFVPDSEVQADFEEPIVADRWKATMNIYIYISICLGKCREVFSRLRLGL